MISSIFWFLLLSLAILKYRQYFLMLQTLKLKNKKPKKSSFYEKKFGRIDSRTHGFTTQVQWRATMFFFFFWGGMFKGQNLNVFSHENDFLMEEDFLSAMKLISNPHTSVISTNQLWRACKICHTIYLIKLLYLFFNILFWHAPFGYLYFLYFQMNQNWVQKSILPWLWHHFHLVYWGRDSNPHLWSLVEFANH